MEIALLLRNAAHGGTLTFNTSDAGTTALQAGTTATYAINSNAIKQISLDSICASIKNLI